MYYRVVSGKSHKDFDTLEEAISAAGKGKVEVIRYVVQTTGPEGIAEEYRDTLEDAQRLSVAILGKMSPSKKKTHRVMVVEYLTADRSSYKVYYDSGKKTEEKYRAAVRNLNARGQKYVHIPGDIVKSMGLGDGDYVEITIKRE